MKNLTDKAFYKLFVLVLFVTSCRPSEISTKVEDYEITEEDREEIGFFPERGSAVDSLFLNFPEVQFETTYYYYSIEEELDDPNEAMYNHVSGYYKFAVLGSTNEAKQFFDILSQLNPSANCVIRVGAQIFAIKDDNDLEAIVLSFKLKIIACFRNDDIDIFLSKKLKR